jgi:glucans biosynthesis protein
VQALTWDEYNAIRFRPDRGLWVGTDLTFQVQFFHLGIFYNRAVRLFEVADGQARPLAYDPGMFDFGPNRFEPPLGPDLGFAGFKAHFHTNFGQDVAVFLGASYFRATDRNSQYGLSGRGWRSTRA